MTYDAPTTRGDDGGRREGGRWGEQAKTLAFCTPPVRSIEDTSKSRDLVFDQNTRRHKRRARLRITRKAVARQGPLPFIFQEEDLFIYSSLCLKAPTWRAIVASERIGGGKLIRALHKRAKVHHKNVALCQLIAPSSSFRVLSFALLEFAAR